MTVSIINVITQYTGTGNRKLFEYGFEVFDDTNVIVTVNGFKVDFVRQDNGVVIDPPPPLGSIILIYRETDVTQLRDFQPFESFDADKTESAVDKLIYLKQEALIYRAALNLLANPKVDKVILVNDKGTDADLFLWNIDKAGMFSGEVTQQMPAAGTLVDKPWDFAYFQYGGEQITYDLLLTTTPYPIEAIEQVQFDVSINNGTLKPIPGDEGDVSLTFAGGSIVDILISYGPDDDAGDVTLTFVDGLLESLLVTIYTPDEEIQLDCSINASGCSMTAV